MLGFFDVLSMVVCITRHLGMSSSLVQELNVCTLRVEKSGVNVLENTTSVSAFLLFSLRNYSK